MKFLLTLMVGVSLLAESAASAEEKNSLPVSTNPQEIVWTPSMLEYSFGGPDPIGGWNRCVFAFNDGVMLYVARPVSWVYSSILPKPVIDGLWNACRNLEYPMHLFSCLGCGEWTGAWDETVRFFVNTTVGVAGIFDPAKDWMHYYRTDSNFGRMFAQWGIGPGCTFMFPFMSFINVRDGVGTIFDYAFDLRTYIPYTSWVYVNEAVVAENQYNNVMKSTIDDRYHQFRILMIAKRELQLRMWEYRAANASREIMKNPVADPSKEILPSEKENQKKSFPLYNVNVTKLDGFSQNVPTDDQPYLDTLYSTLFTPVDDHSFWYLRRSIFNQDFISRGEHRTLAATEKTSETDFDYYFWNVKKDQPKDKLLIILPGIGSLADGNSALAMAEMFNNHGWQAITVNSTFTPQFMLSDFGKNKLPGLVPRDVKHMRSALQKVLADLRKDGKIAEKPWITLMGWSFGGVHTLHIAALEEKENILGIDRYVSLNPPVDMSYALNRADELALVSKGWSREKVVETVAHAFGAMFGTAQESSLTLYNPKIRATRDARYSYLKYASVEEAKFMISLSISSTLSDVILSYHLRHPIPGFLGTEKANRQMLNMQLDLVPYSEYAQKIMEVDKTVPRTHDELEKSSGLYAIESTLRNNPKVRVFHSFNDFLVSDEQRVYLQNTLGNRMFWFDRGGHLGYWFEKLAQEKIYGVSGPEAPAL